MNANEIARLIYSTEKAVSGWTSHPDGSEVVHFDGKADIAIGDDDGGISWSWYPNGVDTEESTTNGWPDSENEAAYVSDLQRFIRDQCGG